MSVSSATTTVEELSLSSGSSVVSGLTEGTREVAAAPSKFQILMRHVERLSESKDWKVMCYEWDVTGYNPSKWSGCGPRTDCVCSHQNIVHKYAITLCPIGSECVKKFGNERLTQQAKDHLKRWKAARKAEEEAAEKARKEAEWERYQARRRAEEAEAWERDRPRREAAQKEAAEREKRAAEERAQRARLAAEAWERDRPRREAEEAARREAQREATGQCVMTHGKFQGRTFAWVARHHPWYIAFCRENARRQELADLVEFASTL